MVVLLMSRDAQILFRMPADKKARWKRASEQGPFPHLTAFLEKAADELADEVFAKMKRERREERVKEMAHAFPQKAVEPDWK